MSPRTVARRKAPPRPQPLACPSCRHVLSPYALEEEAARYLRRSQRTLERLRQTGRGPAYQQLGDGVVTYAYSDLDAWMASIRKYSTSDVTTEDRAATATH